MAFINLFTILYLHIIIEKYDKNISCIVKKELFLSLVLLKTLIKSNKLMSEWVNEWDN